MGGSSVPEKNVHEQFILHRAAWVVPVCTPPLSDGAVLVQGDTIVAVGDFRILKHSSPTGTVQRDHGNAALIPALVNAHTHLELSGLQHRIPFPQKSFGDWLDMLFFQRASTSVFPPETNIDKGRAELLTSGTVLYGDIANGPECQTASQLESQPESRNTQSLKIPQGQIFLEILGFDRQDLREPVTVPDPQLLATFLHAAETNPSLSLAAHACYSTSAELIRQSKDWSRRHSRPFSIHTAEHPEEMEFLNTGSGYCRNLLESLGRWVPAWQPPGTTPVQYLNRLGVLDTGTLLVHLVQMTASDWETVAQRHCAVCFCPRSNHHLNVGRPDISAALCHGLVTALGTDSLASNTDLNLFAEAAFVLEHYPDISPQTVLGMITWGGAGALHCDASFGSIGVGKRSSLLAVNLPDFLSSSELAENIIDQGRKGAWQWTHI